MSIKSALESEGIDFSEYMNPPEPWNGQALLRCKFKSSDTESKCNDKEKTCTITETCYKCGKKYTAVFTYKQLGIPVR